MIYLAEYGGESGDMCQGVVHFPASVRLAAWCPPRWFDVLERLAAGHRAVPGAQAAVRFLLRGGLVDAALIFTAPAHAAAELRHFLAGFLQLLALVPDSARIAQDRQTHNAAADCRHQFLCRIGDGAPVPGEPWLASPFRLWPCLPALFEKATATGHELLYHASLHATERSPEQERSARRNLVALEHGRPVPPGLLAVQRAAMSARAGPIVLLDEYIGTRTAAAARWASAALRSAFDEASHGTRLEPPPFAFDENRLAVLGRTETEYSELIALGVHQAAIRELAPCEFASQTIQPGEARQFFRWSGGIGRWFEPPLAAQRDAGRTAFQNTETAEQTEAAAAAAKSATAAARWGLCESPLAYSFISYRRSDFPAIEPVLGGIGSAGVPFWFDHGIPGASDWLDILQQRIRNCRSLLLFLSKTAAESRYVQMELRYAHALGKPLIPVRLEAVNLHDLPGGLGMLLGPIQAVPPNVQEIITALRRFGA